MAMRVQENAPTASVPAYMRQYADMRNNAHRKKSGAWPLATPIPHPFQVGKFCNLLTGQDRTGHLQGVPSSAVLHLMELKE